MNKISGFFVIILFASTLKTKNLSKNTPYPVHFVGWKDNGNVITTAGISAGIDGALHMVEKLRGRPYARGVAATMEYDKWVPEQGLVINASGK